MCASYAHTTNAFLAFPSLCCSVRLCLPLCLMCPRVFTFHRHSKLGPDDPNHPNFGEFWGPENSSCWPVPESRETRGIVLRRHAHHVRMKPKPRWKAKELGGRRLSSLPHSASLTSFDPIPPLHHVNMSTSSNIEGRFGWRQATPAELSLAMRSEQYDGGDPHSEGYYLGRPKCTASFRHSCLGACRGLAPGYELPHGHRAATLIHDPQTSGRGGVDVHPLGGLQQVLARTLTNGGACSIGFAGDSIMHDLWTASVAGAMRLGFVPKVLGVASRQMKAPTRCVCSAGTALWHALEATQPPTAALFVNNTANQTARPDPFCVSNIHEPGLCYVLFGVNDEAARAVLSTISSANSTYPNASVIHSPHPDHHCRTLRLRYHQIVPAHHLATLPPHHRRIASPREMLEGSSVLLHNAGLMHANSPTEADRLLDENLLPILSLISRNLKSRASLKSRTVLNTQEDVRGTDEADEERSPHENSTLAPSLARLLWLEAPPQHFPGQSGDWQEWRAAHGRSTARSCDAKGRCFEGHG